MKNYKLNLIKGLWDDSHEKQKPQRFARYAAMLIMLLTLGVGQMWAGDMYIKGERNSWSSEKMTEEVSGSKWTFIAYWENGTNYDAFKITSKTDWSGLNLGGNGGTLSLSWNTKSSALYNNSGSKDIILPSLPTGGAVVKITVTCESSNYYVKAEKLSEEGNSWVDINAPKVYWDNTNANYSNVSMLNGRVWAGYGQALGSMASSLTHITGTNLWYNTSINNVGDAGKYTTTMFLNANWSTWETNVATKRAPYAASFTASNTTSLNSNTYLFSAASGNKGATLSRSQLSSGYSELNKTQTVEVYVKVGSGSYTKRTSSWPGTLTPDRYYLSNATTASHVNNTALTASSSVTVSAVLTSAFSLSESSTADGYNFDGWGTSSSSTPSGKNAAYSISSITGANTICAFFTAPSYSITYNLNGGTQQVSPAPATSYTVESSAITLPTPTRDGYDFDGWFDNSSFTGSAITTIAAGSTGNKEYWAKWTVASTYYDVTFGVHESGNGTLTAVKTVNSASITSGDDLLSGTAITFTATPSSYYEVEGWYTNSACTLGKHDAGETTYSVASLGSDITVYVKFKPITYNITYNLNSGTNNPGNPAKYTYESSAITLQDPTRDGYTFGGWYTEVGLTNRVYSIAAGSNGNKAFWAKWTEKMTTVTVNVSPSEAGTLTVGGAAFTPGNTTTAGVTTSRTVVATPASGKVFLDWSVSGNATGTNSTNTYTLKGNGSAGTGTLTANFGVASGWYMEGTAFGGWVRPNTATYQFARPYRGMENVFYYPASLAASSYWKVNDGTKPYSISNSTTAITKKTIYSLTEEWSNSTYASSAMTNIWVVLDKSNKKLWVQDPQTFHNVNVTGADNDKGPVKVTLKTTSAFTKGSNVFETTQFANGETFTVTVTPVTGYIPTITIGGNTPVTWWKEQATYTADGTMSTSDITVTISYTPTRAVRFAKTTGCETLTATGPSSTSVSDNTKIKDGTVITFHQENSTGYSFSKWYSNNTGTSGTEYSTNEDDYALTVSSTANTIYPIYTANTFVVSYDNNGGSGSMDDQNFTYNTAQNLRTNTFTKDGYQFDGWATSPSGAKVYNNGVNGCTISTGDDITLYAHWTKVTVTDLTFAPAMSAGGESVTVTPTLSGTPTGSSSICWGLFYDSECTREVPNISFSPDPSSGAGSATFTCPAASGSYYVKATYRAGSDCNGTVLNTFVKQYVVASEHTVVIKYMQGSTEISSRDNVVVPAASTALVKPKDIFGYTFSSWEASEGITISDPTAAELEEAGMSGESNVKKVSAVIDGMLTAKYTRKNIVYFKNTLGWTNVYYHESYWDNSQGGAGNKGQTRNRAMSLVPGETDIYYWEGTPSGVNVAFTNATYGSGTSGDGGYQAFWSKTFDANVVYPSNPTCAASGDNAYGFNSGTPMFVPISQTRQKYNENDGGQAYYYNKGYWREYEPATGETGYTLEIYNKTDDSERDTVYTIPMTDATGDDIFEATVILEAGKTGATKYGVKFRRDNGMRYTANGSTLAKNGNYTAFSKQNDNYAACGMETTIAGEYTFRVTCGNDGKLKMAVTYPAAAGDYRLMYKDNVHTKWHPSDIVRKVNNGTDIVSFFVRTGSKSQSLQMQNCALDGSGNVTWSNYGDAINPASTYSSVITKDGVYDFYLSMNGSGALTIDSVKPYTGDFYIRTDAVGGTKWADFRNDAHKMTYSDYSAANKGFTHYYVNWVSQNSNVKFTVANDYSPCISDTLTADASAVATIDGSGKMTSANANIRYMYNVKDNTIKRAYLAGAQDNGSHFLVLQGEADKLLTPGGTALVSGNNNGVEDNAIQLTDNQEWLYKTSVKAVPGGKVKLYARYNSVDQYFIGKSPVDDWSTSGAYEALIGGSGEAQNISVVYNFKTDRMIAAWEPANEINTAMTLNADIMIVRNHQDAAANITFSSSDKSLTTDKTIYGVMRFNKYILNNRSTTGEHPVLPVADQLPLRERNHYYISFPFDVNVSDIFGFGTYGVHWVLQYYDGVARAKNGLWADPGMTYWKYVPPTGKLNANEGYLLALSPSQMAYDKTGTGEVWHNGREVVELYFPDATKGATIGVTNVTIPAPGSDYVCTINRGTPEGNRTIKDSYWRCIGVPSFKDYTTGLTDGSSALAWSDPASYSTGDIHFLYEVQWTDYSLRAVSGSAYNFKAMHAYIVQNSTAVVWSSVSAIKSSIVARRQKAEDISNYEFRLTLNQNDEIADQTFIRLTDDENVTNGFEFGHDMSKEMYSTKANIFTYIGYETVAANSMPFTEQTTVVPVGVKVISDGEYTFSMPDGTSGVGITLVDAETGVRTPLSALDYTINLSAGDYTNRFVLEISPIKQTPTGIENSEVSHQHSDVRKVLIDGILYIVKDGKMFDARGAVVK